MITARRVVVVAATLATVVAGAVLAPPAFAHDARSLVAVGLTIDNRQLVRFSTDEPGNVEQIGELTGFAPQPPIPLPFPPTEDDRLVGIDYRPQNGKLYGVGDKGGIFVVDDQTAAVTDVGDLDSFGIALSGRFFGVDFNPAANALRIVSDNGQNVRVSFGAGDAPAGAVLDAPLNYGDGFVAEGISAAAYTNNDLDPATPTQLFDIDTERDQLALQDPPNAGTLTGIVGLGDLGAYSGFDVFSTLEYGTAVRNEAFAIVVDDHDLLLLEIDLADGDVEEHGAFRRPIVDLAIALDQS